MADEIVSPLQGVAGQGVVSVDGRTFTCTVPLAAGFLPGDLVLVESSGAGSVLGQLLDFRQVASGVEWEGRIVGGLTADGGVAAVEPTPFSGGTVEPASAEVFAAFDRWSNADLTVGTARVGGLATEAHLRTGGFNRHTFVCGQSGSGKTYALGVVLERLLAHSGLRMILVDPNADYVRLGEVRPEATGETADRLRSTAVAVLRSGRAAAAGDATALSLRFSDLTAAARAALLEIDPLAEREEYNVLLDLLTREQSPARILPFLAALEQGAEGSVERAIKRRVENLGLLDLSIWAYGEASLLSAVDGDARAVVMDVAGFEDPRERSVAVLGLLDHLWARREERRPVLLVIDEAHNICSAEPANRLQAAATERLIQIAGEGRKYGLWLLLSTQRPGKIHPNVLSQCDNLLLMRMNSPGDLAELGAVFGFAPPGMLAAATSFRLGEMLVAGGFSPVPRIARVGARLTFQGGSDVDVPRLS